MQLILRDIRALAGVTGVAVVVKSDGRIERMFPAAFTERHTAELVKLLTQAYQRLRGFARLSLRFERVVVHLFNQADFLLFVTVLPDQDEAMVETVVKSKLAAISREIARDSRPARATMNTGDPALSKQADPVMLILDICNAVNHLVGPELGLVRAANAWRQARDIVAEKNLGMAALEIEPGGRLMVRKGRILAPTADNIESLAWMTRHFFGFLGTEGPAAEEAFFTAARLHKTTLEHHGFYHFLEAALGKSDTTPPARKPAVRS